jgi:hypothetical protein
MHLAISLDSLVGYEEYYGTFLLFSVLGLRYDKGICRCHHMKLDKVKKCLQTYNKKPEVSKLRAMKCALKLRANMIKVV